MIPIQNKDMKWLSWKLGMAQEGSVKASTRVMIQNIKVERDRAQKGLTRLGPPRDCTSKQYQFLNVVASQYEKLVDSALMGTHNPHKPGTPHEEGLQLGRRVTALKESFIDDMQQKGYWYKFLDLAEELEKVRKDRGLFSKLDSPVNEGDNRSLRSSIGPQRLIFGFQEVIVSFPYFRATLFLSLNGFVKHTRTLLERICLALYTPVYCNTSFEIRPTNGRTLR